MTIEAELEMPADESESDAVAEPVDVDIESVAMGLALMIDALAECDSIEITGLGGEGDVVTVVCTPSEGDPMTYEITGEMLAEAQAAMGDAAEDMAAEDMADEDMADEDAE